MICAGRYKSPPVLNIAANHDSKRHQVIAPHTVVLQRNPIIATTRRIEVESLRPRDDAIGHERIGSISFGSSSAKLQGKDVGTLVST
jgi:hypothetical protein